jgi:hypothetical protein
LPSRYSLVDEIRKRDRLENDAAAMNMAGKPFVCVTAKLKMKYESPFDDSENQYQYICDPYDAAQSQHLRDKWVEDSKVLHGPYIPSGTEKSISSISRAMLPTMVADIYRVIKEDWSNVEFSVLATEDDNIAVRFSLMSIDNERGIESYMNCLQKKGDCIVDYKLKKMVEDWGKKPGDGYIYYMLRSPWVKSRSMETYYTLYPEMKHFNKSQGTNQKPAAK